MNKTVITSALVALLITVSGILVYHFILQYNAQPPLRIEHIHSTPAHNVLYAKDPDGHYVPVDFTQTAERVMDAVVHIQSTARVRTATRPQPQDRMRHPFEDFFGREFFDEFFGPRGRQAPDNDRRMRMGTGSGVIIESSGYIVTNNHVIREAEDIEVTLYDNRNYKARVIGTDPATDLAVLKIDETDLPYLPFADSDKVRVGEWVMAVGNPFNLNSTVTAGIVSAKGRNINILREQFAVESFIQTDAAINPGNSGGALVDLHGGLIGINTAIASPTGAYSGYGFAVPSNLVHKVVTDLIEYGIVQRGYLGVMIRGVDAAMAREFNLPVVDGVYIDSIFAGSAAEAAGLEKGDVIVRINNNVVRSVPDLQEQVARNNPGDQVKVDIFRNGRQQSVAVVLHNLEGSPALVEARRSNILNDLGATFRNLNPDELEEYGIEHGIKLERLASGKISRFTEMQPGFIITKVDNQPVESVDSLVRILEHKGSGGVMVEGIYPNRTGLYYYAFGLDS